MVATQSSAPPVRPWTQRSQDLPVGSRSAPRAASGSPEILPVTPTPQLSLSWAAVARPPAELCPPAMWPSSQPDVSFLAELAAPQGHFSPKGDPTCIKQYPPAQHLVTTNLLSVSVDLLSCMSHRGLLQHVASHPAPCLQGSSCYVDSLPTCGWTTFVYPFVGGSFEAWQPFIGMHECKLASVWPNSLRSHGL